MYNACPDCKVSSVSARRTSPNKNLHQNTNKAKNSPQSEKSHQRKRSQSFKQKRGTLVWTFVRHFSLPLVKIRVVIGCGRTYEPPSHVGARTARTKFAPLALGLCESSHQFTPARHLLPLTKYCQNCPSLQSDCLARLRFDIAKCINLKTDPLAAYLLPVRLAPKTGFCPMCYVMTSVHIWNAKSNFNRMLYKVLPMGIASGGKAGTRTQPPFTTRCCLRRDITPAARFLYPLNTMQYCWKLQRSSIVSVHSTSVRIASLENLVLSV